MMNVPYETVNILEDDSLRMGMKEFSQWPTFPQVYIDGEFYGGCDIMIGMVQSSICRNQGVCRSAAFTLPPSKSSPCRLAHTNSRYTECAVMTVFKIPDEPCAAAESFQSGELQEMLEASLNS